MQAIQELRYSPELIDPARSFISEGRLMSPREVRDSFSSRGETVPAAFEGHWSLCGEMTVGMFDDAMASKDMWMAATASTFISTNRGLYAVFSHQLQSRQHRFLLPLWDLEVLQGVRAMHEGELQIMLARGTEEQAVVFPCDFKLPEIEPLLEVTATTSKERLWTLVSEMWSVVQTIRQLQAVPSTNESPVEEVAISVVPPAHGLQKLFARSSVYH